MMKKSARKSVLQIMLLLSVIGLGVASYQTYEHYFLTTSVCDFTASFSCSVVTESRYGEFPINSGIALAAYGAIWWLVLIGFIYKSIRKALSNNQELYIFLWLVVGLTAVIYTLTIEFYVLPKEIGTIVICPLCTVQHVLIGILLILSITLFRKSLKSYLESVFFTEVKHRKLNPKLFFVVGELLLIVIGGYFILGGGQREINYYSFAGCLAEKSATMYGFKACPNCNKQEHIIGKDAFEKYIEGTGRYVLCRPESEATQPIGERLNNISILPKYSGQIATTTTQGELCALMVGTGTPTWIINGNQVSGWLTVPELSDLSGCPIPENFKGAVAGTGKRITPVSQR